MPSQPALFFFPRTLNTHTDKDPLAALAADDWFFLWGSGKCVCVCFVFPPPAFWYIYTYNDSFILVVVVVSSDDDIVVVVVWIPLVATTATSVDLVGLVRTSSSSFCFLSSSLSSAFSVLSISNLWSCLFVSSSMCLLVILFLVIVIILLLLVIVIIMKKGWIWNGMFLTNIIRHCL